MWDPPGWPMSVGGCTVIALAVRHPAPVANLVLVDTTADYGTEKAAITAPALVLVSGEGYATPSSARPQMGVISEPAYVVGTAITGRAWFSAMATPGR
jgi:pimeloyl-ACP methyl ester carboxylesterase